MKYIWIGMLAIIELIGLLATSLDICYTIKNSIFKFPYCLCHIDWKSKAFIIFHLCALFLYSLYLWEV